ncbi:MAG TPA: hypothetical protein VHD91_12575 [Gaiellaceae bacterium]|nr:hypothetical protein [Gaiellaceae bacterium]
MKRLLVFLRDLFCPGSDGDVIAAFEHVGLSSSDATMAARDLRRACDLGLPTPPWIINALRDARP